MRTIFMAAMLLSAVALVFLLVRMSSEPRICWTVDGETTCMTLPELRAAGMAGQTLPDGSTCYNLPNGAVVCR